MLNNKTDRWNKKWSENLNKFPKQHSFTTDCILILIRIESTLIEWMLFGYSAQPIFMAVVWQETFSGELQHRRREKEKTRWCQMFSFSFRALIHLWNMIKSVCWKIQCGKFYAIQTQIASWNMHFSSHVNCLRWFRFVFENLLKFYWNRNGWKKQEADRECLEWMKVEGERGDFDYSITACISCINQWKLYAIFICTP